MTTSTEINIKLAYSIPEFCKASSLGRSKTYEEIRSGNIVVRKFGKRTVILVEDAKRYLNSLPVLESGNG